MKLLKSLLRVLRGPHSRVDHEPDDRPLRGGRWATCRICGEVFDVVARDEERGEWQAW